MNRIVRAGVFLFVLGVGTRASAASILSGDGELWYSTLASICGGAASCSSPTVSITPHSLWFDDALTVPAASWVAAQSAQITQVPEPAALTVLGLGLTAFAMLIKRRR